MMGTAELIYTTVCRPAWIRAVVNKIILSMLPTTVPIGNAIVVINPRDPVVSGALSLGVYETREIALMQHICRPAGIMVDIGANVGLYTAIAGVAVGPSGRVIAVEPEPESFGFLEKTVAANQLTNVTTIQAAASATNGELKLFTSSANRGDHRMYSHDQADGSVEVRTIRMDDFLEAHGIDTVDIVKIDVQGYEGQVLAGLERTIRRSANVMIMMEFWPAGMTSAGTDPLELLLRLEDMGLAVSELTKDGSLGRVHDPRKLIMRLKGRKYTNLLLLGTDAGWIK